MITLDEPTGCLYILHDRHDPLLRHEELPALNGDHFYSRITQVIFYDDKPPLNRNHPAQQTVSADHTEVAALIAKMGQRVADNGFYIPSPEVATAAVFTFSDHQTVTAAPYDAVMDERVGEDRVHFRSPDSLNHVVFFNAEERRGHSSVTPVPDEAEAVRVMAVMGQRVGGDGFYVRSPEVAADDAPVFTFSVPDPHHVPVPGHRPPASHPTDSLPTPVSRIIALRHHNYSRSSKTLGRSKSRVAGRKQGGRKSRVPVNEKSAAHLHSPTDDLTGGRSSDDDVITTTRSTSGDDVTRSTSSSPCEKAGTSKLPETKLSVDVSSSEDVRKTSQTDVISSDDVRSITPTDVISSDDVRYTSPTDLVSCGDVRYTSQTDVVSCDDVRYTSQTDVVSSNDVRNTSQTRRSERVRLRRNKRRDDVTTAPMTSPTSAPTPRSSSSSSSSTPRVPQKADDTVMTSSGSRRPCGRKSHLCSVCGRGFTTAFSLVQHGHTHTGARPYQCDFCPRAFSQRSTLRTHRRLHTGERPYRCGYCGKRYSDYSTWSKHERTHSGTRPYVCDACGAGFTQSGNLTRHQRTCQAG